MPVNKYFGGHGEKVLSKMNDEYGAKKGKQVFYATLNKRKKKGLADTMTGHMMNGKIKATKGY